MGMTLRTGTSGYSYKAWKGSFYPEDLPAKRFLEYYSSQLGTVEVNNTFYRMPKAETLEAWRDTVGPDFRFVIKASRRITHMSRLKESCDEAVEYLLRTTEVLGDTRAAFLLQLPPNFKKDVERLSSFLARWPREVRAAFEFRHPSWLDDEVYDALRSAGAGLCIAESGSDRDAPLVATTDWGYLRLRREDYTAEEL